MGDPEQASFTVPAGDAAARDALLAQIYDELRLAARRLLARQSAQLTAQPTDLVNEAALRVMRLDRMAFRDQQHLFATCSRILRQTMVDAIRQRRRLKRRSPGLTAAMEAAAGDVDLVRLDAVMARLREVSPELEHIVELRFFVGLTVEEIAAVLDQSESTVKRRWQAARLWLARELADEAAA